MRRSPDFAVDVLVSCSQTRKDDRVALAILHDLVFGAEKVLEVSQQTDSEPFCQSFCLLRLL